MWLLTVVLGIGVFMSSIVQWFTTLGCREEMERLAPEYAAALYRPYYVQLLKRDVVSLKVLFLEPVPSTAKVTVRLLRQVCACWLVLLVAFFLALLLTVATDFF